MQIGDLRLYPVKSCRGYSVPQAELKSRGFEYDRRAMIVSHSGDFLTQRSHPKLAQITAKMEAGLCVYIDTHAVPVAFSDQRMAVRVWHDTVSARIAEAATNAALSDFLGEPVSLVIMDEASERHTDSDFGTSSAVSFADGFPYLITTTASLRALERSAGTSIPMDRFRPNIVIETDTPWCEDDWARVKIGDVTLETVKPCTRCVVTTLDQSTGDAVGQTTMDALIKTRARSGRWGRGVVFGVNAITRDTGAILSVGMPVSIETRR